MKKVVAVKYCDPKFIEELIGKMRKLFLRLKFAFCAIPFLLSAGCAKSIEEKPEATATQNPIEQVISKEEGTPSPTPTSTPMDASFITPMPTATPVQIQALTETEKEKISIFASYLYNHALKILPGAFCESYNEEVTIETINYFRYNFCYIYTDINKKTPESLSEEEIQSLKDYIYGTMVGYYRSANYALVEKVNNAVETSSPVGDLNFSPSQIFEIFENDSYAGLETLKLLEAEAQKVGQSATGDWDTFEANVKSFQTLVEAVFIENLDNWNGTKITSYNNMHFLIKQAAVFTASRGISYSFRRCVKEDKQIKTRYDSIELANIINGNDNGESKKIYYDDIEKEINSYIDACISMMLYGTYDAYLTGNATRKAIIKQLCIEGQVNLY